MATLRRFSPPALFSGLFAIVVGVSLAADQPGNRAVFVVEMGRLLLYGAAGAAILFLLERRLLRRVRREAPDLYPSAGPLLVCLFGVAVAILALVNGQLRRTTRIVTPVVHGWMTNAQPIPSMFGVPQSQSAAMKAKQTQAFVAVEAWWDAETELRLPISEAQYQLASSPGSHPVELIVADGALGIEFVETVRVLPGP